MWELAKHPPEIPLRLFAKVIGHRVLVCGGDGTVNWVLNTICNDVDYGELGPPPVGIVPTGCWNDMSRYLGWSASGKRTRSDVMRRHGPPVVLACANGPPCSQWGIDAAAAPGSCPCCARRRFRSTAGRCG